MDLVTAILALAVTGIGVGIASGLLGVGGCFIMVPVQYWVYTAMGFSQDIAMKVAFGTNLFVVLSTSMSGALGHSRRGAVWWRAGIVLGISGAIGAAIGATIATGLPGETLKVIFGLVILASGIRMLTAKPPKITQEPEDAPFLWAAWGFPLGIVAGLVGIGGGVLMIPVMVLALKFRMHQAVGTSAALMIFTSSGGMIGYIINGLGAPGLPAYSIGYVNIASWLALAATSVPMAQVGVRAAHKLPARALKYVFIAVMMYVGLKMSGVFGWLGLPV
ncbi:MAG: sulfite exporter TauE/SafE family protein [Euryarchaeota archaeon]|nr:sulfite exporter TauE/SafE family protein [Euryarchaeota archaeon]